MGALLQDIRYGLRTLARNPAFSAIAVLTLALGIGANTAIFSLTDQILLRRLPVRNPEQLVSLRTTGSNQGHVWSDSADDSGMFSYPVYKDLRDRNQAFSNLLARFPTSVSVSGQGSTELVQAELVSGNYFEMLGVQPALGRVFSSSDETAPGVECAGGAELRLLGAPLRKRSGHSQQADCGEWHFSDGRRRRTRGIHGIQIGQVPDLFIPITMKAQMTPGWNGLDDRKDYWIAILGRLKPGFNRAKAQVALAPTYHAILESDVHLIEGTEKGRQKFLDKKLLVDPASNGRQIVQQGTGKPLLILTAMVALVSVDCMRKSGQLAGGARRSEAARNRGAAHDGREPLATSEAASHRKPDAFDRRRSGGTGAGGLDFERARWLDSEERRNFRTRSESRLSRAGLCNSADDCDGGAVRVGACIAR